MMMMMKLHYSAYGFDKTEKIVKSYLNVQSNVPLLENKLDGFGYEMCLFVAHFAHLTVVWKLLLEHIFSLLCCFPSQNSLGEGVRFFDIQGRETPQHSKSVQNI